MSENQTVSVDYNSIYLVAYDCATIAKLNLNIKNPILSMMAIPYFALFCHEAEKYLNVKLIDEPFLKEITNIRNAIKIYGERFSKSSKKFLDADSSQDFHFRNLLRFDFMKTWNIHYNLGVYCDANGNVLGNTVY